MSGRDIPEGAARKQIPLTFEDVARLSATLGTELLGYTVRIVSYYVAFGEGPKEHVLPSFLGITKKRWMNMRERLLTEFKIEEERWILPIAQERLGTSISINWAPVQKQAPLMKEENGKTEEKTNSISKIERKKTLPLLTDILELTPSSHQSPTSLSQHMFKLGVEVLTKSGRTESTARTCLARMLKEYDLPYVIEVVDDAWKNKDRIAEPYGWMMGRLKRYPKKSNDATKMAVKAAPTKTRTARPAPTPQFMGISDASADHIRRSNAELCKPIISLEEKE